GRGVVTMLADPGGAGEPAAAAGRNTGAAATPTAAAASRRPWPQAGHGAAVESSRCTAPSGERPWARTRASAPDPGAAAMDAPAAVAYWFRIHVETMSSSTLPSADPPGAT